MAALKKVPRAALLATPPQSSYLQFVYNVCATHHLAPLKHELPLNSLFALLWVCVLLSMGAENE
jgi:hypothetical protein